MKVKRGQRWASKGSQKEALKGHRYMGPSPEHRVDCARQRAMAEDRPQGREPPARLQGGQGGLPRGRRRVSFRKKSLAFLSPSALIRIGVISSCPAVK